jgi:hypothetical protein
LKQNLIPYTWKQKQSPVGFLFVCGVFSLVFGAEDWTQGSVHARKAFYP